MNLRILLMAILGLLTFAPLGFAQEPATPSPFGATPEQRQLTPEEQRLQQEQLQKGCAACGGSLVVVLVVIVGLIALNIALLVWVARDAKSRGMDSAVLWMLLVMFTSVVGLVIYLFARPQGQLIQCPHCRGKRLQASAICPHCQNP